MAMQLCGMHDSACHLVSSIPFVRTHGAAVIPDTAVGMSQAQLVYSVLTSGLRRLACTRCSAIFDRALLSHRYLLYNDTTSCAVP